MPQLISLHWFLATRSQFLSTALEQLSIGQTVIVAKFNEVIETGSPGTRTCPLSLLEAAGDLSIANACRAGYI